MRIKIILLLNAFLVLAFATLSSGEDNKKQFIYGAGPSTKLVQYFFTEFEKTSLCKGFTFEVPPKSVKHAGGIRASEKYIFDVRADP